MISGVKFKSLIHFELSLCMTVVKFHSFVCGCSVFPKPFMKETDLSP